MRLRRDLLTWLHEARMRATEKDKQEFDLRIYREREQVTSRVALSMKNMSI